MNDDPSGRERRASRRIPTRLKVRLQDVGRPGGSVDELVSNVSAGGVFIESDSILELGAVVMLDVRVEPETPIRLKAEVVRVEESPRGMGLRFVDSDPRALVRLLSLVLEGS